MKLNSILISICFLFFSMCFSIKIKKSSKTNVKKQDLMSLLGSLGGGGSGKKHKHKKHKHDDDDDDEDDENMSFGDLTGLFSSDLKNLKDDKNKSGNKNQIDLTGDIKFLGPSITPEESNMNMSHGIYGISPPSNNYNSNSYSNFSSNSGNNNSFGSGFGGYSNYSNRNNNFYNPAAAIEPRFDDYYNRQSYNTGYNGYNNYNRNNNYNSFNNSNYGAFSEYDSNRFLPRFN